MTDCEEGRRKEDKREREREGNENTLALSMGEGRITIIAARLSPKLIGIILNNLTLRSMA